MKIQSLVRENVRRLQPYSSGKSEYAGAADIYIDTNENPFGDTVLIRYPDPVQTKLCQNLIAHKNDFFGANISLEQMVLGNGSDELIDQSIRIFCEPQHDSLVWCPPTFGMYAVASEMNDVGLVTIPLASDFTLDLKMMQESGILQNTPTDSEIAEGINKVIFLCSPNSPTANNLPADQIEWVLNNHKGIVVLDEAYVDFCPQNSFLPRLAEFPNLIIMQTLSKAWGLAGARIGMAFASAEIIALFRKFKAPYNVNNLSAQAALQSLSQDAEFTTNLNTILHEREKLSAELNKLPIVEHVFPSRTNFLLVRFTDGDATYRHLLQNRIVARNFSAKPQTKNCLRLSIGTPQENIRILEVLGQFA
jgi:histidinol-phosphate aminotransferase